MPGPELNTHFTTVADGPGLTRWGYGNGGNWAPTQDPNLSISRDDPYWGRTLSSAQDRYGDPGIHYQTPLEQRPGAGDQQALVFSDGTPLPPDGSLAYYHPDGTGVPGSGQMWKVTDDGRYQQVDPLNSDRPIGEPMAPAGYRETGYQTYAPVDAQGNQIGVPAINRGLKGDGTTNDMYGVPAGYGVFNPATGKFDPPPPGAARPLAGNEAAPGVPLPPVTSVLAPGVPQPAQPPVPQGPVSDVNTPNPLQVQMPAPGALDDQNSPDFGGRKLGDKTLPFMSTSFDPLKPVNTADFLKHLSDVGLSVGDGSPNDMRDAVQAFYAYLPPKPPHTQWLPYLDEASPDAAKGLPLTDEDKGKYVSNANGLRQKLLDADAGFVSGNDSAFGVAPETAWFYPVAQLPGNGVDPSVYAGGSDINPMAGTWKALQAYRDAIAGPAQNVHKMLTSEMSTHTERWVRKLSDTSHVKRSADFIASMLPTKDKGGRIDQFSLILHDAGGEAMDKWQAFRGDLRAARDSFASAFLPGHDQTFLRTDDLSGLQISPPNVDMSVMDKHAAALKGLFHDNEVKAHGVPVFGPSTPLSGGQTQNGPLGGPPLAPGGPLGGPGSRAGDEAGSDKKNPMEALAPLLAAMNNPQAPAGGMPQMPQVPTPQMPQVPNLGQLGQELAHQPPKDDARNETLDRLLGRDQQAQPPVQMAPVVPLGAGVPKTGDQVRPNQLGADGKKLDKDGDGKMDADAVAQTSKNTKPVPVNLTVDGKSTPVTVRDPRIGEMLLDMADSSSKGEHLSVLDAAARSGMEMHDYGTPVTNPLDTQPGDVVVGKETGIYLGNGDVLTEGGTVSKLADIMEPGQDKGIYHMELPPLPDAAPADTSQTPHGGTPGTATPDAPQTHVAAAGPDNPAQDAPPPQIPPADPPTAPEPPAAPEPAAAPATAETPAEDDSSAESPSPGGPKVVAYEGRPLG